MLKCNLRMKEHYDECNGEWNHQLEGVLNDAIMMTECTKEWMNTMEWNGIMQESST